MSFRDISKIIKEYENKIELEERKKDSSKNNNGDKKQVKRISKSSRDYELFLKGRNPVEVAIELDMCFEETRKYWTEFLRLNNMKRLYNIFNENEFHLDYLFKIDSFLLRNEIPIKGIENVLRVAHDITNLYQTHSNLKAEKEKLEQEIKKIIFEYYLHYNLYLNIPHHGIVIIIIISLNLQIQIDIVHYLSLGLKLLHQVHLPLL
jgi:hypothetical protein